MAVKRPTKPVGRSSCEAHRSFIEAEIAKGRNAVAIYQDFFEHHGYEGAYNAVKRFVRKLVPTDAKVSCRFEALPGTEAQADIRSSSAASRGARNPASPQER
jgi:hypothetical protein